MMDRWTLQKLGMFKTLSAGQSPVKSVFSNKFLFRLQGKTEQTACSQI